MNSKRISLSLESALILTLAIFTIGLVGSWWIMPAKYKVSNASPSFGSLCRKSDRILSHTLTIVKEESGGTYDTTCISGTGKFRMYSTKEGYYFDTFRELTSGDIVTVTGNYYIRNTDIIVISGDLVEDVSVKKLPYLNTSPTPTPIRVRVEP